MSNNGRNRTTVKIIVEMVLPILLLILCIYMIGTIHS